jgi:hypothetical protein
MRDAGHHSGAEGAGESPGRRARLWRAPWKQAGEPTAARGAGEHRQHEIDKLQQAVEQLRLGGPYESFFSWYIHRLRRFEKFAATNRKLHQWLRIPALVVATIVPAVIAADFGRPGRLIATALGIFVAAAVGVEEFLGAGRRWRHYRGIVEVLKTEGWMYLARAGKWQKYGSHKEAFQEFASYIGSELLQETERYVRAVAPEPPAIDTAQGQERRTE